MLIFDRKIEFLADVLQNIRKLDTENVADFLQNIKMHQRNLCWVLRSENKKTKQKKSKKWGPKYMRGKSQRSVKQKTTLKHNLWTY